MVKLVEINGLDESGDIGGSILFVRVGAGLSYEQHIILRNITYFKRMIVNKRLLRGYIGLFIGNLY